MQGPAVDRQGEPRLRGTVIRLVVLVIPAGEDRVERFGQVDRAVFPTLDVHISLVQGERAEVGHHRDQLPDRAIERCRRAAHDGLAVAVPQDDPSKADRLGPGDAQAVNLEDGWRIDLIGLRHDRPTHDRRADDPRQGRDHDHDQAQGACRDPSQATPPLRLRLRTGALGRLSHDSDSMGDRAQSEANGRSSCRERQGQSGTGKDRTQHTEPADFLRDPQEWAGSSNPGH